MSKFRYIGPGYRTKHTRKKRKLRKPRIIPYEENRQEKAEKEGYIIGDDGQLIKPRKAKK